MKKTILLIINVIGILPLLGAILFSGCGQPGWSDYNSTHSEVIILSINDDQTLLSDVLTQGSTVDDSVKVVFQSLPRGIGDDTNPTDVGGISAYDTIVFRSYHISHLRTDQGTKPDDFTAGVNFTITPGTTDKTVYVTVVRALDKSRTPLKELWESGQIFTTTTITLYGEDGYGNGIAVQGSFPISFANFPDSGTSSTE